MGKNKVGEQKPQIRWILKSHQIRFGFFMSHQIRGKIKQVTNVHFL